jgi:hypothetical protein
MKLDVVLEIEPHVKEDDGKKNNESVVIPQSIR